LDKEGNLILGNARGKVTSDPKAEGFPWKPKTLSEILSGSVVDHSGNQIALDTLKTNTANAIYFSAHWCPPCRGFTPKLIDSYKKIKAAGKSFEIIFASSDQNEEEFKEYFATMPWLSFPLDDKRISELSDILKIEGIPSLVIFDGAFTKVLNSDGRTAVDGDPEGADFPWLPKPLDNLEHSGKLNDMPCLVYLETNLNEDTKSKLQKVAEHYFSAWKNLDDHPLCFLYGSNGDLAGKIRTVTNVKADPALVILDVQEGLKYPHGGADLSEESMKTFVQDFLDKKLKSVGLRE